MKLYTILFLRASLFTQVINSKLLIVGITEKNKLRRKIKNANKQKNIYSRHNRSSATLNSRSRSTRICHRNRARYFRSEHNTHSCISYRTSRNLSGSRRINNSRNRISLCHSNRLLGQSFWSSNGLSRCIQRRNIRN